MLTGDETLRSEGVVDQISGNAQKAVGAARDAVRPIFNPGAHQHTARQAVV